MQIAPLINYGLSNIIERGERKGETDTNDNRKGKASVGSEGNKEEICPQSFKKTDLGNLKETNEKKILPSIKDKKKKKYASEDIRLETLLEVTEVDLQTKSEFPNNFEMHVFAWSLSLLRVIKNKSTCKDDKKIEKSKKVVDKEKKNFPYDQQECIKKQEHENRHRESIHKHHRKRSEGYQENAHSLSDPSHPDNPNNALVQCLKNEYLYMMLQRLNNYEVLNLSIISTFFKFFCYYNVEYIPQRITEYLISEVRTEQYKGKVHKNSDSYQLFGEIVVTNEIIHQLKWMRSYIFTKVNAEKYYQMLMESLEQNPLIKANMKQSKFEIYDIKVLSCMNQLLDIDYILAWLNNEFYINYTN
eukprot:CAMPEP_0170519320 /NCGR_PEP_ID=MMETSP0209-20121228/4785_1 /TAXON_ID=665100 ORGANISM="Litonotus pictus, Strain P1" /NCGR_SAMPLE_ID=MMETSP0209 /ASSEMBLY_ACC=CAM_ASM_000301 /LENGTH=358 /DNA_ID=CAMNT_0010805179 /DNA_START=190 /DNA_END=1263 /DNA_ORIENTATION=-